MKHDELEHDFWRAFDHPKKIENPHADADFMVDQALVVCGERELDEAEKRITHSALANHHAKTYRSVRHLKRSQA